MLAIEIGMRASILPEPYKCALLLEEYTQGKTQHVTQRTHDYKILNTLNNYFVL